jgi:hypothetical protein
MFAKIFEQIFDSSIAEDAVVRHTFMDLLVLCDQDGVVDMTVQAIARRTKVPEETILYAIAKLSEPDSESRSHLEDGRRLVPLDSHRSWGWQIVNYNHYRHLMDEESRRQYFRDMKRQQRLSKTVQDKSKTVRDLSAVSKMSKNVTQAEAEVDTKAKAQKPKDGVGFAIGVLTKLEIPSSTMLIRLVGDAINFRCSQTGNPEETEADFIIAQYRDWEASPSGQHDPRLSPANWFQGKHYNDDPQKWRQSNDRPTQDEISRKLGEALR